MKNKFYSKIPTEIKTILEVFTLTLLFIVGANIIITIFTEKGSNTLADVSSVILTAVIVYITISNNKKTTRLQEDIKLITEDYNKQNIELQKQIHKDNVNVAYLNNYLEIYNAYRKFGKLLIPDTEFDYLDFKPNYFYKRINELNQYYEYAGTLATNAKIFFRNDEKLLNAIRRLDTELLAMWNDIREIELAINELKTNLIITIKTNTPKEPITRKEIDSNIYKFMNEYNSKCEQIIRHYNWDIRRKALNDLIFNGDFTKHFEQYIKPAIKD